MDWKKLDDGSYEGEIGGHDFHVRREGESWVLDVFRSGVGDAEAHVESLEYGSLEEAQRGAEDY